MINNLLSKVYRANHFRNNRMCTIVNRNTIEHSFKIFISFLFFRAKTNHQTKEILIVPINRIELSE